jgi:FtsP/CotA-like multicopper oxidase with cupredoxin domain
MAFISKRNRRLEREAAIAARNRRELIAAGLTRRDLARMGLLTSAGFLVGVKGLSAWGGSYGSGWDGGSSHWQRCSYNCPQSPPTTAFAQPLLIPPVKQPVASLSPAPTIAPNTPAGEGRTRSHQALSQFPPQAYYQTTVRQAQVSVHPELPLQTLWTYDGSVPGPTVRAHYGQPILVRYVNSLPTSNGGFGLPSISPHLHNGHVPSESDGFPCDFFEIGQFYDQHYPNMLAGFSSGYPPDGDIREALSTLWYHDHRADHTAENVYKGLAGFYLLYNQYDTGDETTGFRLPSGEFDVPMLFGDRMFDQDTGLLTFDLMNTDGILGDKFLVNGRIQPFFQVKRRRYRLRWINGGPSRFYQLHLTNPNNFSQTIPFWQIATDGNLLPKPLQVNSTRLSVAERADVIIDFSQFPAGTSIFLENRLEQTSGKGPSGQVLAAGQGDYLLRFDVVSDAVTDASAAPTSTTKYYDLPPTTEAPRVTRYFQFSRRNGQWTINDQYFNCDTPRFYVKRNTVEKWVFKNDSRDWQHPIHVHFEEFQILKINGYSTPTGVDRARKDVLRLEEGQSVEVYFRFRDFTGRFPLHCHNVIHEDHSMMLRFDIDDVGDTRSNP